MRELWGTFSVRDHCNERAFVAEVILYDRLVIPYPPDTKQWERWEQRGWQPERQRRMLKILRKADLVVEVPWDKDRRTVFRKQYEAAQAADHETVNAWAMTAHQLLPYEQLQELLTMEVRPKTVAAYTSRARFKREVPVRSLDESTAKEPEIRKQELAMVLGYEFLVPDEIGRPSEELDTALLERAVKVAARRKFREKRAAFHDWLEQAVAERYTNEEAIAHMRGLLADYNNEIKRAGITTRVDQAFLIAGTGLAVAGHFFPPLWLGTVVLAPARYVAMKVLPDRPFQNAPPAMFHEARSELSRRPLGR